MSRRSPLDLPRFRHEPRERKPAHAVLAKANASG
jgi:hypothetical protein